MMLVYELLQQEMQDQGEPSIKITAKALQVLQEVAEMPTTILIEMSNHYTIHVKYVTLIDKDIRLVRSLMDIWNPTSWLSTIYKGYIDYIYGKLSM